MPNVRASSATIGTMRGPSVGSFSRSPSMRTDGHRRRHLLAVGLQRERARSARAAAPAASARRRAAPAARRRAPRGARAGSASRRCRRPACRTRSASTSSSDSGSAKRSRNARSAVDVELLRLVRRSCATRRRRPCRSPSSSSRGSPSAGPGAPRAAANAAWSLRKSWPPRLQRDRSRSSLMCATSACSSGSWPKKCSRL